MWFLHDLHNIYLLAKFTPPHRVVSSTLFANSLDIVYCPSCFEQPYQAMAIYIASASFTWFLQRRYSTLVQYIIMPDEAAVAAEGFFSAPLLAWASNKKPEPRAFRKIKWGAVFLPCLTLGLGCGDLLWSHKVLLPRALRLLEPGGIWCP